MWTNHDHLKRASNSLSSICTVPFSTIIPAPDGMTTVRSGCNTSGSSLSLRRELLPSFCMTVGDNEQGSEEAEAALSHWQEESEYRTIPDLINKLRDHDPYVAKFQFWLAPAGFVTCSETKNPSVPARANPEGS